MRIELSNMLSFKQYILEVIVPALSKRMTTKQYKQSDLYKAGIPPQEKYLKVDDNVIDVSDPNAVSYHNLLATTKKK